MIEGFAAALLLSVLLIRILIPLAVRVGFVDVPSVRKRHRGQIPLCGGLAIYAALLALWLIFPFWSEQNGAWLIALGFPLLLIGLADDRWNISPAIRLLVEICCSLFAVMYCGIRIDDIGHLLPGVGGTLVMLAIPMTVLGIVGGVNAMNMTDGVDGLAGGLALLTFAALAWLAFPSQPAVAQQLISFVAVMLGFLVFNSRFFGRERAAVFMGEGGVTFIGFAIVWYLILLSQGTGAVITPVSALWLFTVPLVDTMTIMARRICRGQSPVTGDREHLHHILLLAGYGKKRTVLVILSSHLFFIFCGMASIRFQVPSWITFGLFVGVFAIYYASMSYAWKIMKKIKSFREWAGFEDRRNARAEKSPRRSGITAAEIDFQFSSKNRRKMRDRRGEKGR